MTENILYESGEAVLFLPKAGLMICVSEGTGDNLLYQDIAEGYVDYINLYSYRRGDRPDIAAWIEDDGGMALFKKPVSELSTDDIVEASCFQMGVDSALCMALPCAEFDPVTGHIVPVNG